MNPKQTRAFLKAIAATVFFARNEIFSLDHAWTLAEELIAKAEEEAGGFDSL